VDLTIHSISGSLERQPVKSAKERKRENEKCPSYILATSQQVRK
jgi:hypothetical protein